MKSPILPKTHLSSYHGKKLAQYIFLLLTTVTIIRSLIHIFAADGGAESIATLPLNTYSNEAANAVVMMFALWGVSQLLLGLVYLGVYFKYPALIPAMYVLIILEYLMRLGVGIFKPAETLGTAPGAIGNYILIPLSLFMLILSLKPSKKGALHE